MVRREEIRIKVMLRPEFKASDDTFTLVTVKNDDSEKKKKKNLGAIISKMEVPFTKEQLEHLHKIFQSSQFRMDSSIPNSSNGPSCSFA